MPTLKQRTAFKKMVKNMSEGNPKTMGEILLETGYDITTSEKPIKVISSKGFQLLLDKIDDEVILNRFREILVDEDKRASLQAGVELLKLKDRYPASKSKVIGLFETIGSLEQE